MKIKVMDTTQKFYDAVAWELAVEISKNPNAVIGLSTGRTTGGIHAALCEIYKNYKFDTSKATFFGVDEVTGVSRDYFGSCYYMLLHEVIKPLDIPLENYIMPDPFADDFTLEAKSFKDAISNRGQVDVQILGIGENGHLGFNQPQTPFGSTAWLSKMDEALDKRIRKETNSSADASLGGLTLGIADIMHSKRIILAANGENKSEIIKAALYGPVTEDVPASILQLHPNVEFYLDSLAASEI